MEEGTGKSNGRADTSSQVGMTCASSIPIGTFSIQKATNLILSIGSRAVDFEEAKTAEFKGSLLFLRFVPCVSRFNPERGRFSGERHVKGERNGEIENNAVTGTAGATSGVSEGTKSGKETWPR